MLVVKDGRIVSERYARGVGMHTPQRTWSVAKSLTSALIGRAAALNVIDPMAPAHVPEWGAAGACLSAIGIIALLLALNWWRSGRSTVRGETLLRIPLYLLWKLPVYLKLAGRRESQWVRTKRAGEE